MKEIWKDIKGYPNYMVSNTGKIKSLGRWIDRKCKGKKWQEEKILKSLVDNDGYLFVRLCKNGKVKNFKVHRLVAQAFISNPNNYPCVNHKDENKTNNFVYINEDGTVNFEKSNIEWCDAKYNNNYGTRNKRVAEKMSKLVLQIDIKTNEVIAEFPSTMEVQRQLGISISNISECCNNKPHHNTAYGFKWKYK